MNNPFKPPLAKIEPEKSQSDKPWHGVALLIGLHIAVPVALSLVGAVAGALIPGHQIFHEFSVFAFLVFGLLQVFYAIPAFFWLRKHGRTRAALGLAIAAGVSLLINAACFGLVMYSISNGGIV